MANEFRHGSTVSEDTLYQSDWEKTTIHLFNSQATGDILYASATTQLSRLGIGATNKMLVVIGGVPTWQSTLAGLTLTSPTINGTIATTGLTMPALTLGGALTINNQQISIAANALYVVGTTAALMARFETANDTANASYLEFYKNSASPADNDFIGGFTAEGKNDKSPTAEKVRFGDLFIYANDVSDTSEDATLQVRLVNAGTQHNVALTLSGAGDLWVDHNIKTDNSLFMTEQAAALADVPGDGQFWVKNATPNTPYFTDDAGTDHQLLTGATGTKHEFHLPFEDPTGAVGNWDVVEINAAQDTHFTFQVPESFESLVNAKIVMIPDATETIQWDMNASVAAAGEAHDNDDRTAADQTLAVTADQLTEVDISGQLTGLTPGDYVGIDFQSDIANLRIIGFEFDYL